MPCDALLLSGNVVVDESMLTGESIPCIKSELPKNFEKKEIFDKNTHSVNVLFSGTKVLQTNKSNNSPLVVALVFGTGYSTSKGDLIRSILNPKPTKFKFYRDSMRFVLLLALIGLIGVIYLAYQQIQSNTKYVTIFITTVYFFFCYFFKIVTSQKNNFYHYYTSCHSNSSDNGNFNSS